ncbi:MAG: hypothetical protein HKN46_02695, partial [Acidimicrobiia bacterium]|nr:hypothetical protein [Acidimicrobiia bacterium]
MSDYTVPLGEIQFILEHIAGLSSVTEIDDFAHATPDMVEGILFEAARFFEDVVAPLD